MVNDNDDSVNYYGHYRGGKVDTDTVQEPMELPEDHPAAVEDSGEEDAAGGDSADPDAVEGEEAPEDGGDDPDDDPEPAAAADTPPPEPHYKKCIAWTLQKVRFPCFSRGPCRGLASH